MYSKQQIQEAGKTLVKIMEQEDDDFDNAELFYAIVDDLLLILDGKLKPAPGPVAAKEMLIVKKLGFIPLVGQVVDDEKLGNRVEWFGEDDDGSQ